MKDFNEKMVGLGEAMGRFSKVCGEIVDIAEEIAEEPDVIERMKNCVNCEHSEVCVVVARRKAQHPNDYSPCSKWKLVSEK